MSPLNISQDGRKKIIDNLKKKGPSNTIKQAIGFDSVQIFDLSKNPSSKMGHHLFFNQDITTQFDQIMRITIVPMIEDDFERISNNEKNKKLIIPDI